MVCAQTSPSATDQICRHARLVAGDEPALRREQRSFNARALHVSPCGDMVRLDGMLPATEGATVIAALDALAQPTPEEASADLQTPARSRAQRMADALVELAQRQLAAGGLPAADCPRPALHLTIPLTDLLERTGTAQLETRGGGTATWSTARLAGCDATVDWTVIDGVGVGVGGSDRGPHSVDPEVAARLINQLAPALRGCSPDILATGRTIRLVTPAIRRALARRDKGCAYPGCDRPPDWCDAHHLVHWADGGPTDLQNLALVCGFHHTRLHVSGETLRRGASGYHRVPADPRSAEEAA